VFLHDVACQKLLKSANVSRSYSQKTLAQFFETRCTYTGTFTFKVASAGIEHLLSFDNNLTPPPPGTPANIHIYLRASLGLYFFISRNYSHSPAYILPPIVAYGSIFIETFLVGIVIHVYFYFCNSDVSAQDTPRDFFFCVTWPCSFTTLRHVNRNSCIIIIIIIIIIDLVAIETHNATSY